MYKITTFRALASFLLLFSFAIDSEVSMPDLELLEMLPPDQRASIEEKMSQANSLQDDIDEAFDDEPSLIKKSELRDDSEEICEECIFGYDYFSYSPTSFAPASNIPVPSNYTLGPGDTIDIVYYGNEETQDTLVISREGLLNLPILGPINLMGIKFDKALEIIEEKVKNELIGTFVSLSLSEVRSINIFLLGEAHQPGVYTMSGLSSITSALFVSGGVNKSGSLREIEVKRNGKIVANYDFYDFLLSGNTNEDIKLQNGDVIFIPFIQNKVELGGQFKRPHIYEFKKGETIKDIIDLAGGYKSEVQPSKIELNTIGKGNKRELFYLDNNSDSMSRPLRNGDTINVSSPSSLTTGSIELSGEFNNPGVYSILPGDTILDILNRAGGYTTEAYIDGAIYLRDSVAESQKMAFSRSADELEKTIVEVITKGVISDIQEYTLLPLSNLITRLREEEPLGRMVVDINTLQLKTDPSLNFKVRDGDSIYIPKRPSSVSVVGEVLNNSTLSFDPNKKVADYIELSGGLSESADSSRIFVIEPNGQSRILKKTLFSSSNLILPGSTIVVSRDSRPFDAVSLTQIITPVLADLATSAAAIAALND